MVVNFQGGFPKPVKCNLRKRMARVIIMGGCVSLPEIKKLISGNDLAFVFIHHNDHERHLLLLRHGPLRMKYSDHSGDLNNEDGTTEWLISSMIRQSTSLGDSVHEFTLVGLFNMERF